MKPGRELDALVAEKVMGWKLSKEGKRTLCTPPKGMNEHPVYAEHLPKYSTDIAAAWQVVEKLGTLYLTGPHLRPDAPKPMWRARFTDFHLDAVFPRAESAAEAICLAALKAVGHALPDDSEEE